MGPWIKYETLGKVSYQMLHYAKHRVSTHTKYARIPAVSVRQVCVRIRQKKIKYARIYAHTMRAYMRKVCAHICATLRILTHICTHICATLRILTHICAYLRIYAHTYAYMHAY